jgi:hypothetical protein
MNNNVLHLNFQSNQ